MTLNKEQIKSIRYFINCEVEKHKFGEWDKFKITSLRIHSNGDYSFKVHWMTINNNINDDYWLHGNLFDEFPVFAVLDGLDAVQLLFHKVHRKAYERSISYSKKGLEGNDSDFDNLRNLYKPGGYYNKENKIISDVRYE